MHFAFINGVVSCDDKRELQLRSIELNLVYKVTSTKSRQYKLQLMDKVGYILGTVYYNEKEKLEKELYKLNNALKDNKQNFKDQFFTFENNLYSKASIKIDKIVFIETTHYKNEKLFLYKLEIQLDSIRKKAHIFYKTEKDRENDFNRLHKLGLIKKEK
jgi:hypothetical protein